MCDCAVEKELTGREEKPSELIYFKVYKSQIPVIERQSKRRRGSRLFPAPACLCRIRIVMVIGALARDYSLQNTWKTPAIWLCGNLRMTSARTSGLVCAEGK